MLINRIKGGLFGVAVGDALGGTTEFMTASSISQTYGVLTEIIGGGVWGLEPGEVTDDTMMTIAVAEGILKRPDDPMKAIGEQFIAWYETKPKDVGNIIRHVLEQVENNWFEAAFLADQDLGRSGGNGSLMRCLPVALAYDDPVVVSRITRMQSCMTHYDERCDAACVIYNRIAYRLIHNESLHEAIACEIAGTEYERDQDGLLKPPLCEPTGYVVDTMHWVIFLLLSSSSFEEVVQGAANRGGDADTIGAIAGGLAGIYYGYDAIPERYRKAIMLKQQLHKLAEQLMMLRLIGCK
ncbi:ADP-ribosylglycohydrolase family protein [Paenibacillus sp. ACRRX]|uniref:ADP-ribosylglycohydrolase family protein n=1 Tax=Paenibacillus sp. ACRRX TaxID=2918206 RepID=UPI001EF6D4DA|nr:ADP-ribosylglycohydrolase family protein [Paenibacillus sp. ACRRX]MCG7409674.1 ADP-ribosylglycohydrolase family protein [Paenibacillus sp. ACRRX]